MIQAVDGRLLFEQELRIADVAAKVRGHGRGVAEERGEDAPPCGDDWIARIEDVEGGGAGIGIHDDLDAVAHVVDCAVAQGIAGGIGIAGGGGEGVEHPVEMTVIADHDIGIGVPVQERRERTDPAENVTAHEKPALRRDVVAEGNLPEVAAIGGDEGAADHPAQNNASGSLIRREIVGLALRIIEFFLICIDIDVGVRELAEIDFRPRNSKAGNRALDRHVAEVEGGQTFRRETVHGVHGDAVASR